MRVLINEPRAPSFPCPTSFSPLDSTPSIFNHKEVSAPPPPRLSRLLLWPVIVTYIYTRSSIFLHIPLSRSWFTYLSSRISFATQVYSPIFIELPIEFECMEKIQFIVAFETRRNIWLELTVIINIFISIARNLFKYRFFLKKKLSFFYPYNWFLILNMEMDQFDESKINDWRMRQKIIVAIVSPWANACCTRLCG